LAETTTRLTLADITSIVFFDSTGTRKTLPIILKDGDLEWTEISPDAIETQDALGNFISVRDGARDGRSEVTFSGDIFDAGGLTTEATFIDLLRQSGYVGSTWASTVTTQANERKMFGLEIVIANRNASGALKGGTYTWASGDFVSPRTVTMARDGAHVSGLKWRATQMTPTYVRAS
jgi:hypothetical protein